MTEPSEEYIRGIKGVKILINENLNDDEIMVSPGVDEKMKSGLKGKPVGYSPKYDEDFQKMIDELGEVNEKYPAFDLTPPNLRCIPEPLYLNTPTPSREEIIKKAIEPLLKEKNRMTEKR